MVSHEGRRVGGAEDTVNHHGERDAEVIYRCSEGDVLAVHINQDLCKTGGQKVKAHD